MEVCAGFELIAIENATALGHDVLEISKRPEAQMIGHMRHGSPPRLMAFQSILSPNRRESLPTPLAGVRITLTEAAVKKAGPGFLRDDKLIGFGLRTTPAGSKSFFVEARVKGQPRRFTIGSV